MIEIEYLLTLVKHRQYVAFNSVDKYLSASIRGRIASSKLDALSKAIKNERSVSGTNASLQQMSLRTLPTPLQSCDRFMYRSIVIDFELNHAEIQVIFLSLHCN